MAPVVQSGTGTKATLPKRNRKIESGKKHPKVEEMSRQSKKVVAAVDELTQEEREVGGREVERGQDHRGGGDHHGVDVT